MKAAASLSLAWSGAAAIGLGACVEPDPFHGPVRGGTDPAAGVAELAIDAGGQVQLEPGSGIAVAVEYVGEGQWSVTTSCDTELSRARCSYDLVVSTDEGSGGISDPQSLELEADDSVVVLDAFALGVELLTGDDTDGFGFTTSPGATVRVSALLYDPSADSRFAWSDDPRFITWVGDGGVHRGAPTNPVDLTPNRP